MDDIVVANLHGGVPSALIDRAFAQLPGLRRISAAGMLWSHAVVTHTDAEDACAHWLAAGGANGFIERLRAEGFRVVAIGGSARCSAGASEHIALGRELSAEAHDLAAAYHAVRLLLSPRPPDGASLCLLLTLRAADELSCHARIRAAPRACAVEAEAALLPKSVYADDARIKSSFAHRVPALQADAARADRRASAFGGAMKAGEHAARLHTAGWRALERVDEILRALCDAVHRSARRTRFAVLGDRSLAMREHGAVGAGTPWRAATRSFMCIHTNSIPLHERRPTSLAVFPSVLLDLCGVAQGSAATAPAWTPAHFAAITVKRAAAWREEKLAYFVRAVVTSTQMRTYAWTVWFGAETNGDLRRRIGALSLHARPPDALHHVYELTSDVEELDELWSDEQWRAAPFATTLWETVRHHLISAPESMMADAAPIDVPSAPSTSSPPSTPAPRHRTATPLQVDNAPAAPESHDEDGADARSSASDDSWESGPSDTTELNR